MIAILLVTLGFFTMMSYILFIVNMDSDSLSITKKQFIVSFLPLGYIIVSLYNIYEGLE